MKKILLIGANGQLGSDICKVCKEDSGLSIIPLDHSKIEVTNFESVASIIGDYAPDVVINTTAFHQVDECETKVKKTLLVNVAAVRNLAIICKERNIIFVHYSTDYVFGLDQQRTIPYAETDKPGPVNMYGISKLAGEYAIQYIASKFYIIRVAGLFGTAGASGKGGNFVETMLRIAKEKGVVKVKNDEVTTPTYTKNVAENTLRLLKDDSYGIYHMTSNGECSWFDFAKKIFELSNTEVDCQPVPSSEFPTEAIRPRYTALRNKALQDRDIDTMPTWEKALRAYLIEKGHII